MEWVHPVEVVQEQAKGPEWVDHEEEREVVRERVQDQKGCVYALNVARLSPMKRESLATTKPVQNVVQRWCEDNSQF